MTGPLILYESRLLDAVPVASSTAAGFDVLNLRDMRDYTLWKPSAMPATVTVDSGSSKAADYLAVYGHDLFSTGCTIEVRKSTDNFAANDVLVATSTPADNKTLLLLFTSASSRYWRIRVLTGTAPTLSIALLGVRLEMPKGVKDLLDPLGHTVKAEYNRSVTGRPLGKVIQYREWKANLIFEALTWDFIRASWVPAWDAWLQSEPWLFAWHPDSYPKESYLVVADGSYSSPHDSNLTLTLTVPVTGVIP